MSKLVITELDKDQDVWVCKDAADVEMVKNFFDYIVGMSECISKLISNERIFTRDDAENMTICGMMLMDECFNTITREIKAMGYAIRMSCSLARDMITAEPDPGYRKSIMLDPRDTIDYTGAFKQWREKNHVRAGEIYLIAGFLADVGYHYKKDGKVVTI